MKAPRKGLPAQVPKNTMQELESQVLSILDNKAMTCAQIGQELWGAGKPWLKPQSFSRPAGRIIRSLERKSKVTMVLPKKEGDGRFYWKKV